MISREAFSKHISSNQISWLHFQQAVKHGWMQEAKYCLKLCSERLKTPTGPALENPQDIIKSKLEYAYNLAILSHQDEMVKWLWELGAGPNPYTILSYCEIGEVDTVQAILHIKTSFYCPSHLLLKSILISQQTSDDTKRQLLKVCLPKLSCMDSLSQYETIIPSLLRIVKEDKECISLLLQRNIPIPIYYIMKEDIELLLPFGYHPNERFESKVIERLTLPTFTKLLEKQYTLHINLFVFLLEAKLIPHLILLWEKGIDFNTRNEQYQKGVANGCKIVIENNSKAMQAFTKYEIDSYTLPDDFDFTSSLRFVVDTLGWPCNSKEALRYHLSHPHHKYIEAPNEEFIKWLLSKEHKENETNIISPCPFISASFFRLQQWKELALIFWEDATVEMMVYLLQQKQIDCLRELCKLAKKHSLVIKNEHAHTIYWEVYSRETFLLCQSMLGDSINPLQNKESLCSFVAQYPECFWAALEIGFTFDMELLVRYMNTFDSKETGYFPMPCVKFRHYLKHVDLSEYPAVANVLRLLEEKERKIEGILEESLPFSKECVKYVLMPYCEVDLREEGMIPTVSFLAHHYDTYHQNYIYSI